MTNGAWSPINDAITDADGRCKHLLPSNQTLATGHLPDSLRDRRLLQAQPAEGLYPYVEIVFDVRDGEQHYHIPLLLTANGYTTYRGS